MHKKWFLPVVFMALLAACNSGKKEEEPKGFYFPVLSFLQSQVAHIDTSLYPIIKLTYIDSIRTDTEYIRREDFRALAKDFLDLPDLTVSKFKKRYSASEGYDEMLGRVVYTYLPKEPEKEVWQKQEVMISPGGNTVHTILADYLLSNRDSSLEKKMLWRVDQSFQITTIKQKPGTPETITTIKVTWNEPAAQ